MSQTVNISNKYYCIAFVFGLYTNLRTDMQNWVHMTTWCNDDFELLHVSNSFLLPRYRTSWTIEMFTKYVSRFFFFFGRSGNRVMYSGFFLNWLPSFASRLPQSFDDKSCRLSRSMIILCSKATHFTVSTAVSTYASVALSRILHFEAQIPKARSTTRRARGSL